MSTLHAVRFYLPRVGFQTFGDPFLGALAYFGDRSGSEFTLRQSNQQYVPAISFALADVDQPSVVFETEEQSLNVPLRNDTGVTRQSPHTYQSISLDSFCERLRTLEVRGLDHVGFNLPWFDGLHPAIATLRTHLAPTCAYYRFPTGEEWDFILPATTAELASGDIDLAQVRRPKVEIVNFDKASTPLIQIDFSVAAPFTEFRSLFAEGIIDEELKNVWAYVENPYGVDICFVVNIDSGKDWSSFFAGHRL